MSGQCEYVLQSVVIDGLPGRQPLFAVPVQRNDLTLTVP
jgi:hypothetical protein